MAIVPRNNYLYSAQKIFPARVRVLGGLLGRVLTAAGHGCEARVRGAGRVHGAAACSERGTGGCESPVSVVALPWPSLPVCTSGTSTATVCDPTLLGTRVLP